MLFEPSRKGSNGTFRAIRPFSGTRSTKRCPSPVPANTPSAKNRNDLPRVLLIGDSIVRGYFGDVERALEGRANCARLTTSRCICDPVFYDKEGSRQNG